MDLEEETWKFKLALGVGLLFLVSSFFAWRELKYLVWGTTVDATLNGVTETQTVGRRGRSRSVIEVSYTFADRDGTPRREADLVPTDWPRPAGPTVPVQFIPGSPDVSRLHGHRNVVSLVIFFTCLAILAGFVGKLVLEAREYGEEKRRRAAYARR